MEKEAARSRWELVCLRAGLGPVLVAGLLLGSFSAAAQVVVPLGGLRQTIAPFAPLVAEDEDVSGGFSLPTANEEIVNALADYRRHVKNKAWDKAFKSMEELAKTPEDQMLQAEFGIILPAGEVARRALAELPPEGREAYNLFFDAQARKILQEAENGTSEEQFQAAKRVHDEFFLSSEGDRAANLLGDAWFQRGEFLKAEQCWHAILTHHPGTRIPEPRLLFKRAFALHRAGDRTGFRRILVTLMDRFANEQVTVGGRQVKATDYLASLPWTSEEPTTTDPNEQLRSGYVAGLQGAPAEEADPIWQFQFLSEPLKTQFDSAVTSSYYRMNSPNSLLPAVSSDGQRIYGNWIGNYFAIDATTGKLLWRNGKFSKLASRFSQLYRLDLDRYSVAVGSNRVAFVTMDPERVNYYREPYRLVVVNAENGVEAWTSQKAKGLQSRSFAGNPIVRGNTLLAISHEREGSQASLQSLRLEDGEVNWTLDLGTAQASNDQFSGSPVVPAPTMTLDGDMLYYLSNNGAFLAVDIRKQRIAWAIKIKPPVGTGQNRSYNYNQPPPDHAILHTDGCLKLLGNSVFFKESRSERLYSVDLATKNLTWRRPVDETAMLTAVDSDSVYMISRELLAFDRETMALRWSSPVPMEAGAPRALVGDEALLVFTRRGIYELDRQSGDVRRIFRGHDLSSRGGSISLLDDKLICISDQAITAYPAKFKKANPDES